MTTWQKILALPILDAKKVYTSPKLTLRFDLGPVDNPHRIPIIYTANAPDAGPKDPQPHTGEERRL